MPGTDAITLLKKDHKLVQGLFKQFEKLHKKDGSDSEKQEVANQILKELTAHAFVEETIFYPMVRDSVEDTDDIILESYEEHHLAKMSLAELEKMDPTDERFDAKVIVLKELIKHHIKEEEEEMFPKVREALGRNILQEIGAQMEQGKLDAPQSAEQLPDSQQKSRETVGAGRH